MSHQKKLPPFQTANLLRLLFERALPMLTPEELSYVGRSAGSHATWLVQNAADVAETLGCQISAQGGEMSSSDVATTLFHFVDVLREAAELQSIGSDIHTARKYAASDGGASMPPH